MSTQRRQNTATSVSVGPRAAGQQTFEWEGNEFQLCLKEADRESENDCFLCACALQHLTSQRGRPRPHEWHVCLHEGGILRCTLPHSGPRERRCLILQPPLGPWQTRGRVEDGSSSHFHSFFHSSKCVPSIKRLCVSARFLSSVERSPPATRRPQKGRTCERGRNSPDQGGRQRGGKNDESAGSEGRMTSGRTSQI